MNKESHFISNFKSKKIGDDGAIIDNLIYSKDIFAQNTHFKLGWMSLYQIAQKSMLVNISDAIAMNAKSKYALIGIVIPSHFSKNQIDELAKGFNDIASKYNIEIIGGDTTSGDLLMISITIISQSINPIKRNTMKCNDLIAYTGNLGSSKKDLDKLLNNEPINKDSKFIKPILRDDFFFSASNYINCALDISDGLSKELERLSIANNLGFNFHKEIKKDVLCSGEEYEILFSFSKKNEKIIKEIANKNNTKISIIATATKKELYSSCCSENHFN